MTNKLELPDMNDMLALIDTIRDLSLKKMTLEIEIDQAVGDIIKKVRNSPEYFENGKPASTSYVEKTFGFTGIDGELIGNRKELAKTTSELEHARLLLKAYQDLIEIWRTKSANERASVNA